MKMNQTQIRVVKDVLLREFGKALAHLKEQQKKAENEAMECANARLHDGAASFVGKLERHLEQINTVLEAGEAKGFSFTRARNGGWRDDLESDRSKDVKAAYTTEQKAIICGAASRIITEQITRLDILKETVMLELYDDNGTSLVEIANSIVMRIKEVLCF